MSQRESPRPETLRDQLHTLVTRLPHHRLTSAADFLHFLLDQESDHLTQELQQVPDILEDLQRAEADVIESRMFSLAEVRQRYQ